MGNNKYNHHKYNGHKYSGKKNLVNDNKLIEMTHLTNQNDISKYHCKYSNKDNKYWGIGIENECYLQCDPIVISGASIIKRLGRERYSIDYRKNYNMVDINELIEKYYSKTINYKIYQMINAHSLDKMDRNGQHKTTYEKIPKLNSKFIGKTILEEWFEYDPEMKNIIDAHIKTRTNIFFDGDTIEFITDDFYKTNSKLAVKELKDTKDLFINKFNKFKKDTKLWEGTDDITFVTKHPGLNVMKSQPNTIVLFNNTTYHLHITLPTEIYNGMIIDNNDFDTRHMKAIRLIQWFEPLFLVTLSSPDLFGILSDNYTKGSMRCTLSRYIGIGTYDTNQKIKQKTLVAPIKDIRPKNVIWWRDMVEKNLKYNLPMVDIGLDFNYAKHYQSGFEFRLLDGFPIDCMKDVIDCILLICCHALSFDKLSDMMIAQENQTWNDLVYSTITKGYNATITKSQINELCTIFNIKIDNDCDMLLENFYFILLEELFDKYHNNTLLEQMTQDFTKINRWKNFNKVQFLEHINTLM
jgi:hypothetical protein